MRTEIGAEMRTEREDKQKSEKIMLIEDDKDLSNIMKAFLTKEGFEVICAFDGQEGMRLAKDLLPTLILLDIMLPGADGMEVCYQIRTYSLAPIIIISAKNSDMDKLLTLGIGADDYLTKPFSMLEMGARVKSHIRRYTSFQQEALVKKENLRLFGDLAIDPAGYRVTVRGSEIEFTSREFQLLDYLSSHPSRVFTKEQLMDQVWGFSEYIDPNTITVYIGRIREKLSKYGVGYIKTVWGVGYKWEIS